MRRFLFGVVIASVTAAMPSWAFGGDREIARAVMTKLQEAKESGSLKGFDIDLKVQDGVVYLDGTVASQEQMRLVAQAATSEVGAENLVNTIDVESKVQPASAKPMPQPVRQAPVQPTRSDSAVTDTIIAQLQQHKAAGHLRGFELDVSTVNGDVWLRGKVSNQAQKDLVLEAARRTRGVARVVDDISVTAAPAVRQVSTGALEPAIDAPTPVPQVSSMPVAGHGVPAQPQAFAPSGFASAAAGVPAGRPVAMQGAGGAYGVGAPRYDQPNMPSYAWPSYAAHPNYSAVTYPKQYSPSAWPYIGPFYPYPQVPLGWRKVSLEWDDGLWYLDFTSK